MKAGRAARFVTALIALVLRFAPLVAAAAWGAAAFCILAGLALILSIPRAPVGESYGNWGGFIR